MSFKHQAFLVARVIPKGDTRPRYRCVGGIHHKFCYGSLAMKAVLRFIALIKQDENLQVIREELSAISGLYGAYGEETPVIPKIPLPFAHFLLYLAWSVDMTQRGLIHAHGALIFDASMGSTQFQNDTGITIIDITDPQSPSYCFVSNGIHVPYAKVPDGIPLSAERYVRAYYRVEPNIGRNGVGMSEEEREEFESTLDSTIQKLEETPLMGIHALQEAWPGEYGEPPQLSNTPTTRIPVPQLVDLILRPAIAQANLSNSFELLEVFLLNPERMSVIKRIMKAQDCLSKAAIAFLKQDIWGQDDITCIDLSGFHLDENQLTDIFSGNPNLAVIKVLNLSHNNKLCVRSLESVLSRLTSLRRLVIFDTPITDDQIYSLIKKSPQLFHCMEGLLHPAFLRFDIPVKTFPVALTIMVSELCVPPSINYSVSIPYFSPDQILQGLSDFFSKVQNMVVFKNKYSPRLLGAISNEEGLKGLFATQAHQAGNGWMERVVPFIPTSRDLDENPNRWYFAFEPQRMKYALGRLDTDVLDEFYERFRQTLAIKAIPEKEALANNIFTSTVQKIIDRDGSSFKARLYRVFDVQAFFRELESEGKPAPSPQAMSGLLEVLEFLSKLVDRRWKPLTAMSSESFYEFLVAAKSDGYLRRAIFNESRQF